MAELSGALAGRGPDRFGGHDAIDRWTATKKIVEAAGLPETWGRCKTCDGHGIDPAHREAYEAWEKTEPPEGEGWQLWETVSEGSPVSPVLPTREAFVDWLVSDGHSRAAAEKFTESGWAPSMVMQGGRVASGVDAHDLMAD